jgi:hypothetical protein
MKCCTSVYCKAVTAEQSLRSVPGEQRILAKHGRRRRLASIVPHTSTVTTASRRIDAAVDGTDTRHHALIAIPARHAVCTTCLRRAQLSLIAVANEVAQRYAIRVVASAVVIKYHERAIDVFRTLVGQRIQARHTPTRAQTSRRSRI